MWLYAQFTRDRGKYHKVELRYCTGQSLKVQLVISYRLVGEGCKESCHYENEVAREIHERHFIET
jgi:hypothetical protein